MAIIKVWVTRVIDESCLISVDTDDVDDPTDMEEVTDLAIEKAKQGGGTWETGDFVGGYSVTIQESLVTD